jgi:hypothetical protein
MAGDDKPVAGIIAATAAEDNRSVDSQRTECVGYPPAGVFHKDNSGDAILVHRTLIEAANLVAVESWGCHGVHYEV